MSEIDTVTDHTPADVDLLRDAEAAYQLARVAFDHVHSGGLRMFDAAELAAAAGALATSVNTLHTLRTKEVSPWA